jgi:hypothetical protein
MARRTKEFNGVYVYSGLDRVDNTVGYTLDNVVPACKACNHAKVDMSYAEFTAWIARLATFHLFRSDVTQGDADPGGLGEPACLDPNLQLKDSRNIGVDQSRSATGVAQ